MLRIGDQIGPYTLINKIGRGSFGVVWLAERRSSIIATKVALKIPLDEEIDLDAIKQEATLWVEASGHPNVLPIIEANVYDDLAVIASEYASDGSLDAWLKKHGGASPSIEMAIEITSGILAGLEHLHARRIIHRDLKPANVLLQGETPRLADFGVSRVLKTTSLSNVVAGTPMYMAPEAFEGRRDEQTDLWSVGVLLYQMLAGRLPFPQSDIASLINAIQTRNADPLPLTAPSPLRDIITCALDKDTQRRYKSATKMRKALRTAYQSFISVNEADLATIVRDSTRPGPFENAYAQTVLEIPIAPQQRPVIAPARQVTIPTSQIVEAKPRKPLMRFLKLNRLQQITISLMALVAVIGIIAIIAKYNLNMPTENPGSNDNRNGQVIKDPEVYDASLELFPVYGVTLGKTTVSELKKLGKESDLGYNVQGIYFKDNNHVANRMHLSRHGYKIPPRWEDLGFNWELSYNELISLLVRLGYSIKVTTSPMLRKYKGSDSFFAELEAEKRVGPPIKIEVTFKEGQGTTTDSKGTLYSMVTYAIKK